MTYRGVNVLAVMAALWSLAGVALAGLAWLGPEPGAAPLALACGLSSVAFAVLAVLEDAL